MSDLSKPPEQKSGVGFLIAEEQKTFDALQNFFFIVWVTDPNRDTVRIILNDGSIKLWLKRDKFMKVMKDLLGPRTHELEYTLYRFEQSMHTYGVWYYYDRIENNFQEVGFKPDLEHLNPMDLIKETTKSVVKQELTNNFKAVTNQNEKMMDGIVGSQMPVNHFERFFKVIRNFQKKK